MVIDEFAATIRVNTEKLARQIPPDVCKSFEDPDLSFVADRTCFGPSGADVGDVQGLTEITVGIASIVADQIDLNKTGSSLVPLRKCADRDLMLQH